MSIEVFARQAITNLRKKIDQGKLQEVDPAFLAFLEPLLFEISTAQTLPEESLLSPIGIREALALVHSSFFSRKLKESGVNIKDNRVMKDLMVESSARLRDWLVFRDVVGHLQSYNLIIWRYLQSLNEKDLPRTFEPDIEPEGLAYLRSFRMPTELLLLSEIITMRLRNTDISESFLLSKLNGLVTAFNIGSFIFGPSEVSFRRQANVITHNSFRNTDLESMHAGNKRLSQRNLIQLEGHATHDVRNWLIFMDALKGTKAYSSVILSYWKTNCDF